MLKDNISDVVMKNSLSQKKGNSRLLYYILSIFSLIVYSVIISYNVEGFYNYLIPILIGFISSCSFFKKKIFLLLRNVYASLFCSFLIFLLVTYSVVINFDSQYFYSFIVSVLITFVVSYLFLKIVTKIRISNLLKKIIFFIFTLVSVYFVHYWGEYNNVKYSVCGTIYLPGHYETNILTGKEKYVNSSGSMCEVSWYIKRDLYMMY